RDRPVHGGGRGRGARRRGGAAARRRARRGRRRPRARAARRRGRPALTLSPEPAADSVRAMRTRVVGMGLVVGRLVAARAFAAVYSEDDFFAKPNSVYTIPTPSPGGDPTVIGEVKTYRIRQGDTLMDLARLYGLGYNEIVEANPGLDPWVPPTGAVVLLPT